MRDFRIFRRVTAFAAIGLLAGCCAVSDNGGRGSTGTGQVEETRSRPTDFSGKYAVSGEGYDDIDLVIKKEGKYYNLEWVYPGSESARGVELSGCLCAYTQGEDGIVGIYKKQDSGITGLWVEDGEYAYESSKNAKRLEPSSKDFSGVYDISSADVGDEEAYMYRLTIEKEGEGYRAKAVYEDGSNTTDEVVTVDGVIVMGFPQDGILVMKAFQKSGSKLKGKVIYAFPDYRTGIEQVSVGTEEGERVKD